MPYKTVWDVKDGWMEARQVWVPPTDEETKAQMEFILRGNKLADETMVLTKDIRDFLKTQKERV